MARRTSRSLNSGTPYENSALIRFALIRCHCSPKTPRLLTQHFSNLNVSLAKQASFVFVRRPLFWTSAIAGFLGQFGQSRNYFKEVADYADMSDLKDWRIRVFVDSDDPLGISHAG